MALVRSNKRKITELGGDDIRRMFKRSLDEWLKENEDDIFEKPSKDEQSEMVTDLVSLWQDTVEMLVDSAVTQYCDILLDAPDEEDEEIEADSEDSDEDSDDAEEEN